MAKKRDRTILILGGTGFIGEPLVEKLEKEARISVVHAHPLREVRPSEVLYYRLDAAYDENALRDLIASHDTLIILTPPHERVIRVISDIIAQLPPRRILYASSSLLYEGGKESQKEDAPLSPTTPYERAKLEEETLLKDAAARSSSQLTIARLGSVYGHPKSRGIVSKAFHALMQEKPLSVHHSGANVRDYVHVDDVVHALSQLALDPKTHDIDVINISTGKGTSVAEMLAIVEAIADRPLARVTEKGGTETPAVVADNTLLKRRIGEPKHDLKSGLKKTWQHFRTWYDADTAYGQE